MFHMIFLHIFVLTEDITGDHMITAGIKVTWFECENAIKKHMIVVWK
jgi:hypothetical protein